MRRAGIAVIAMLAGASACAAIVTGCGDDDVVTSHPDGGAAADAAAPDAPPLYDAGTEAGPVSCGTTPCAPADYRGLATLPACCTAHSTCGLDLRPAARWDTVGESCTALANPGIADDLCPTYTRGAEDGGVPVFERQGCCMPDKTCGVFVKLGSLDLGCVPTSGFVSDAGTTPISCVHDAEAD